MKNSAFRLLNCGVFLLITATVCHAEEKFDRERYQAIVLREPFGTFEKTATVSELAKQQIPPASFQSIEKLFRLSFLLESGDGREMIAGFQVLNPEKGQARTELLKVNESSQGLRLVEIDMKKSFARVEYQGRVSSIKLSAGNRRAQQSKSVAQSQTRTKQPVRQRQPRIPSALEMMSPEERAEHYQQLQMDIIRNNQPALPVALTVESDDQLVNEGVLPPRE